MTEEELEVSSFLIEIQKFCPGFTDRDKIKPGLGLISIRAFK